MSLIFLYHGAKENEINTHHNNINLGYVDQVRVSCSGTKFPLSIPIKACVDNIYHQHNVEEYKALYSTDLYYILHVFVRKAPEN